MRNNAEKKTEKAEKGKEYAKRPSKFGFNISTMMSRVNSIAKNKTFNDWRRTGKLNISYTYLIQTWHFEITNKTTEIVHFCPWGMREAISKKMLSDNCKARY